MDDFAAVEAERWVAVLLGLGLYGYFGLEAARRLGLPWTVHSFLSHLLFLVVAGLTIRAIYRLRAYLGVQHPAVGRAGPRAPGIGRYVPWRALAASSHHVLAGWVALVYLAWAVGVPGGAVLLTRGLLVIDRCPDPRAGGQCLARLDHAPPARGGSEPAEEGAEPVVEPLPAMQVAAITAMRLVVAAAAILIALQGWGVDVVGWLEHDAGRTAVTTAVRIAVIGGIVLAMAATGPARRRPLHRLQPTATAIFSTPTAPVPWSA